MLKKFFLTAVLSLCAMVATAAKVPDLKPYLTPDVLSNLKLSPTGEYVGGLVRTSSGLALAVLKPENGQRVGSLSFVQGTQVVDFWWVSDKRLIVALGDNFGTRDAPTPTGELYGVDFDGGRRQLLVGYRVKGGELGSRITSGAKEEYAGAELLDTLPGDDNNVLVTIWPWSSKDPVTRVDMMDVFTGRRKAITSVPVKRAQFQTDSKSRVRFAYGTNNDNNSRLYYRADDNAEWKLINDETQSGFAEYPLGFARDDVTAYLMVEQKTGPDRIVAMNTATGQRREVASDPIVNPDIIQRDGNLDLIGARFLHEKPRSQLFDPADPDAKLQMKLEQAFPGTLVSVASSTRDGKRKLVRTSSDVDPGTYYMLHDNGKADFYLASQSALDVERMSPRKVFTFAARDGMQLHGYLTMPRDAKGPQPMVVLPHGGPFGVHDSWHFDNEAQLLAEAGYVVLQVNFRGSGHYGRAYERAGRREWGGTMQDDVTDATRWAIKEGHADAKRICIYGASYGAYAALMGAAKEPDLYRCAAGYVGVYDLRQMIRTHEDDSKARKNWLRDWLGDEPQRLEANSPNRMADRIRVPVFLAAGGEDTIAPIKQTRDMEAALKRAKVPVESLYYPNEGHGFYTVEHQTAFYQQLLAFLGRNIGNP